MSLHFSVQRSNTHLSPFHLSYEHSPRVVSDRDRSLKKAFCEFFKSENFTIDPRKKSCVLFDPISFSEQHIDVIIGVWKKLRSTRSLEVTSAQRFHIKGLCDITLFNKKGKTLIIHAPFKEGTKTESRSLDYQNALMMSAKKVSYIKEHTTLDSLRKSKIDRALHPEFLYSYSPLSSKSNYIKFCELFTLSYDLRLDEFCQWRSAHKLISAQQEWMLLAQVASVVKELHKNQTSYGKISSRDIFLKFHKKALCEYAKSLKSSVSQEHQGFPFKELESITLKSKPLQKRGVSDAFWEAKIEDIESLALLFKTFICLSPNTSDYTRKEKELLVLFFKSMKKNTKSMRKALDHSQEAFSGFSLEILCRNLQIFSILQHVTPLDESLPFGKISEYLSDSKGAWSIELDSLSSSFSELYV